MDSVSALCGRLPSDEDPFLDLLPLEAAAGSSRPGDPDAKPLPQRAAAQIELEEMRFLTRAEIVDLAEAIHARNRALVVGPSGCRPSSSMSWRHTLPPRSGPAAMSLSPLVGAAAGSELSGALWVPATKAAGLQGLRIHDLRHTAVALWIAAGATPKESPCASAYLGQLHPGPLRPPDDPRPAAEGRCLQ
jgi:integrase